MFKAVLGYLWCPRVLHGVLGFFIASYGVLCSFVLFYFAFVERHVIDDCSSITYHCY